MMARYVNILRSSSQKLHSLIRSVNVSRSVGLRNFNHTAASHSKEDVQDCEPLSRIFCGVCIQRHPVLVPPMTKKEEKFLNLMGQMEVELSKYSDHEMRHFKDLERAELKKQGEEDFDDKEDNIVTAMDMEDAWENELAAFQPAQINECGIDSPSRMMNKKLILFVKQSLGQQTHWVLPQTKWQPGESLRETADRVVRETLPTVSVAVDGNAPIGVYKYSFMENGARVPAKIFFYRAEIKNTGRIPAEMNLDQESMWLSSSEISSYLHHQYCQTVSRFLLDL